MNSSGWGSCRSRARQEPVRNRVMLALAYDAALRREELCSLRTDDLDPAHRTLRVRAETTKNRLERVVPYSASTGVLMSAYLAHRATVSRARGPLFLSESRRNHGQPLTLWTWSKVVRRIALEAGASRFSTHTTRHLCPTDLARSSPASTASAQAAASQRGLHAGAAYIECDDVLHREGSPVPGGRFRLGGRTGVGFEVFCCQLVGLGGAGASRGFFSMAVMVQVSPVLVRLMVRCWV
ncbi:site-specific integrase [Kitasatospora herbaricolor]|uniref:Site-specific integrase n=1 Tax=Kitasatospora herbaricolor TaxID=68217 RepID=A0ABZ1WJA7_9ACTN|nr:site-specific integrase [Kitasatospora herbaricolor]